MPPDFKLENMPLRKQFYWRRARDHFADKKMDWDIFDADGIEPSDIEQGKIANSYFLAGLAGMAESM